MRTSAHMNINVYVQLIWHDRDYCFTCHLFLSLSPSGPPQRHHCGKEFITQFSTHTVLGVDGCFLFIGDGIQTATILFMARALFCIVSFCTSVF